MALENFIPEIWSARLIRSLKNELVYGQPGIVNREYEGEINDVGDTVHILGIGPITINNYAKNTDIAAPQELQDTAATLTIDQQKYFHFQVDDVDAAQGRPEVMDAAMEEAAFGLSSVADAYLAAQMVANVPAASTIGTQGAPIAMTASTAYERLVDLKVKLTEANVPRANRFVVVPPWYVGLLEKDDRFVKAGTGSTDAVLRNGFAGTVSGLTVLESNAVPNTADAAYQILAGTPMATTFAEQIRKVEAYRPERRFGDAMKGLHLYGSKVVRPEALAKLYANRS
jgi:hypothetical protein